MLILASGKYNGQWYHAYAQEVSVHDEGGKIGDRHFYASFSRGWKPFGEIEYLMEPKEEAASLVLFSSAKEAIEAAVQEVKGRLDGTRGPII
jgi:hypothetical protein